MEKKFKCKDKVIYRVENENALWTYGIFSHYIHYEDGTCSAVINGNTLDTVFYQILPYVGNEHLVGTTDEPEPEIRLEEGEWIMVSNIANSIMPEDWNIRCFHSVNSQDQIKIFNNSSCEFHHWKYAIRFRDFDPSNMDGTRKHILEVKNGKIMKYKNKYLCQNIERNQ